MAQQFFYCLIITVIFYLDEREVNVGGTSCMCGGTHVKNTQEIGGVVVTKMKKVHQYIIPITIDHTMYSPFCILFLKASQLVVSLNILNVMMLCYYTTSCMMTTNRICI